MKSIGKTSLNFMAILFPRVERRLTIRKERLFQRVRMKYIGFNLNINLHFRFGDSDNRE